MINKQNLWFLTLFSLILVLSVYYITMPNELLLTKNNATTNEKTEITSKVVKSDENVVVSITDSEVIESLKVNKEEEREEKKKELQTLLINGKVTSDEKNNAYNELKQLEEVTSKEANLEKKLKETYKFPVYVKLDGQEVTVVIDNDKHDTVLANNIMRSIQEEFKDKVYITVQFK